MMYWRYWNLKVFIFKENEKPEYLAKKPLEAYRMQKTVNKLIHCTFMGISPLRPWILFNNTSEHKTFRG